MFRSFPVLLIGCVFAGWASPGLGQSCPLAETMVGSCGSPRVIPGDPGHYVVLTDATGAPTGAYLCDTRFGNAVWYEVTPTVPGPLTFSTCHPHTSYDTVIAAFSGGNDECQGMVEEGCNDDGQAPECDNGCSYFSSTITIHAIAGTRYRFAVGAYGDNAAGCTLCLGVIVTIGQPCGDAPTNSACQIARELPGTPGIHDVEIDVTGAPSNPESWCGVNVGHSVWHKFTPTVSGTATFSTCHENTTYDTVARVRRGPCGGIWADLTCNNDTPGCDTGCGTDTGSEVTFSIDAGVEYLVEVAANGDNSANCDLCLGARLTIEECTHDVDCDDGDPCTDDVCAWGECTNTPLADGAGCGSDSDTDCDNPDTCLGGVCQSNYEPTGTTCSDDGEECTEDYCHRGACTHPAKPLDTPCGDPSDTDCTDPDMCRDGVCESNDVPDWTPCASDASECTDDVCVGGHCTHPHEPNGTACGDPSSSDCDGPDSCSGGVCQPNHQPSGTQCRSSAGVCDVAEYCTGSSPDCPVDEFASSSTLCRAPSGVCDLPEYCEGSAPACPADLVATPSTLCRSAAGECDLAEYCDGSSHDCPADSYVSPEVPCTDDGDTCTEDYCDGAGACVHPTDPSCLQPEACCFDDGHCEDLLSTLCSDAGGTPQGTGTECSGTGCPQPVTACCFSDDSCEDLASAECTVQGGEVQLYRRCAEVDCLALRGACCFADGTCQDLRHTACLSAGGMGFVPDQTCATHTCSQSVACCFADGTCEDLTPGVCVRSRGEPGPYASACSDDCNGDSLVDACQLLGDADLNGTVDLDDWSQTVDCLTGPGIPVSGQSCRVCILDCDDDVDLLDMAIFQRALGEQ